jgi:putative heme-binding domain-containing protein
MRLTVLLCLMGVVAAESQLSAQNSEFPKRRAGWTTSRINGTPDPPPPYIVEPAFDLTFEQPLDLAAMPGSNRLFVAEQKGRIHSFPDRTDIQTTDLAIDLKTSHPQLTALYAITFHPRFEQTRKIYVCYVEGNDKPDGTFVSEFAVTKSDPPVIDPASERILIRWWSGGHNGCSLKFGPDGFLYISTGDGGAPSPPDPLMAGQDVSNLLSCILRIDVDHPKPGKPYSIPEDNPFIALPGARPEIWAFGFRNPWRMSFDRATGDLWVGDVGWQLWEMIYRVERGGNYGWPIMEGPQPALPESPRGPGAILPPIVSHPHSEAASITGGYVYHGQNLPELQGAYIYGDYQSGRIWSLRMNDSPRPIPVEIAQTPLQLVSFGEDLHGELYLVDYQRTQKIYRMVPNPAKASTSAFPSNLSETGLFASLAELQPAEGVREYHINAHHWADGMTSRRWMAIPGDAPVSIDDKDRWSFPEGTVLTKLVTLPASHSDGASRPRRIETQILHREDGSWRAYSYRWNEQGTDAELVPGNGATITLNRATDDSNTPVRELRYRFAARGECQMCHNPWVELKTTSNGIQSASPLAVSLAQLDVQGPSVTTNEVSQLQQLEHDGWILRSGQEASDAGSAQSAFVNPYDESAPLDDRVRSWLHVNCSHCHQPHAGGSALIQLTRDIPLADMKLLDARPTQGAFGIANARLVAPGDPHGSLLYYRILKTGAGRMPRIGSELVDEVAVAMLREWIRTLGEQPAPAAALTLEVTTQLQNASEEQAASVVNSLTSTTRGAVQLAEWLSGPAVDSARRLAIARIAAGNPRAEVRDLFERFLPASERVQRLGSVMNSSEILAASGSVERGREVFFREGAGSCRSCHRVTGVGETIGPDLTSIGKKYSRAEMLTHLLEPSRFIDVKYVAWIAETKDGLVYSGLLEDRNEQHITLKLAEGKTVNVPTEDIENLVTQPRSLMPELLLRDLTMQQAADLLEFLTSLRN